MHVPTSSFPRKTPVAEYQIAPPNLTYKPVACHFPGSTSQETIDPTQKTITATTACGRHLVSCQFHFLHLTSHDNHNHRTEETPPAMPPPFIKAEPSPSGATAFNHSVLDPRLAANIKKEPSFSTSASAPVFRNEPYQAGQS